MTYGELGFGIGKGNKILGIDILDGLLHGWRRRVLVLQAGIARNLGNCGPLGRGRRGDDLGHLLGPLDRCGESVVEGSQSHLRGERVSFANWAERERAKGGGLGV